VIETGLKDELNKENISEGTPFRLGSKDVQIQEELSFNEGAGPL